MFTCSKIEDNITQEDGIGNDIEDYSAKREIIIEEGDGNRKNYEIGDKKEKHANVPIKPEKKGIIHVFLEQIIKTLAQPSKVGPIAIQL